MRAKEYLSQAYKIDNDINSKLEQVASLRDLATKATSTMSDMPGSPNRNIHKMEDAIVKIIAPEDEINSDIHVLISLKADITHMIKRVSNRAERTILEKRFFYRTAGGCCVCSREMEDGGIRIFYKQNIDYL